MGKKALKGTKEAPGGTAKAPAKGKAGKGKGGPETVALGELVIEYVDSGSIKPNSYNPNVQQPRDFDLLCKSMREDGFTQPVIVHRASTEIVDGEHRWRAAGVLGINPIPVVFVDMTEEQRRVATLRHNRARGSESAELSVAILRDLKEMGALDWAKDSLDLEPVELEQLLRSMPEPEIELAGGVRNSDEVRAQEVQLEKTRGQEEASKLQGDTEGVFRVVVKYTPEQAAVVRRVIGYEAPARKVVELCQAYEAAQV